MSRLNNKKLRWELRGKLKSKKEVFGKDDIVKVLLENRGIKTMKGRSNFFNPMHPKDISLEELEIDKVQVKKAVNRIKKAKLKGEKVIIYGDYDADGITGTAVLWETLDAIGISVLPYLPDRFSEGYGLNGESIKNLKENSSISTGPRVGVYCMLRMRPVSVLGYIRSFQKT